MIFKVLLVIAAGFGLYWSIKTNKTFPLIITIGMILGIALTLFPLSYLPESGFYIYMAFVALAFFYGLAVKKKQLFARIVICLISALLFAYWLWVLNHWHGNTLLAPLLALVVAMFGAVGRVKLRNELGFITLMVVDAALIILESWLPANL